MFIYVMFSTDNGREKSDVSTFSKTFSVEPARVTKVYKLIRTIKFDANCGSAQ